jgi:hypothetical protein
MAVVDTKNRIVFLPDRVVDDPPANPNVVTSWRSAWAEIPDCDLKDQIHETLSAALKAKDPAFLAAFEKACGKASQKSSRNPPPKPSSNPSREALGIHKTVGSRQDAVSRTQDSEYRQQMSELSPPAREDVVCDSLKPVGNQDLCVEKDVQDINVDPGTSSTSYQSPDPTPIHSSVTGLQPVVMKKSPAYVEGKKFVPPGTSMPPALAPEPPALEPAHEPTPTPVPTSEVAEPDRVDELVLRVVEAWNAGPAQLAPALFRTWNAKHPEKSLATDGFEPIEPGGKSQVIQGLREVLSRGPGVTENLLALFATFQTNKWAWGLNGEGTPYTLSFLVAAARRDPTKVSTYAEMALKTARNAKNLPGPNGPSHIPVRRQETNTEGQHQLDAIFGDF